MVRPGEGIRARQLRRDVFEAEEFHTEPMQREAGSGERGYQVPDLARFLPPANRTQAYERLGRKVHAGALVEIDATPVIIGGVPLENRNPRNRGREGTKFEEAPDRVRLMPAQSGSGFREYMGFTWPVLRSGVNEFPDLTLISRGGFSVYSFRYTPCTSLT